MRLLPISILYTLFVSVVIAESSEQTLGTSDVSGEASVEGSEEADGAEPTIFNGIQVPPLPVITGEKFNATVKDGYWFVKHHSYVCQEHSSPSTQQSHTNNFLGLIVPIAYTLRRRGRLSTNTTIPRNLCQPALKQIAPRPL